MFIRHNQIYSYGYLNMRFIQLIQFRMNFHKECEQSLIYTLKILKVIIVHPLEWSNRTDFFFFQIVVGFK